jgi:hypothetical protein
LAVGKRSWQLACLKGIVSLFQQASTHPYALSLLKTDILLILKARKGKHMLYYDGGFCVS